MMGEAELLIVEILDLCPCGKAICCQGSSTIPRAPAHPFTGIRFDGVHEHAQLCGCGHLRGCHRS